MSEKGLTWEAVMLLSLDQIRERFPRGATREPSGLLRPALNREERSVLLRVLLKWRRRQGRLEPIIYLRQSYNVPKNPTGKGYEDNYTFNPNAAVGVDKHGRGVPEWGIPLDAQRRYSTEARLRRVEEQGDEAIDWQAKAIANKIAKVQRDAAKVGIDMAPALHRLLSETQRQIADRRKQAA